VKHKKRHTSFERKKIISNKALEPTIISQSKPTQNEGLLRVRAHSLGNISESTKESEIPREIFNENQRNINDKVSGHRRIFSVPKEKMWTFDDIMDMRINEDFEHFISEFYVESRLTPFFSDLI